MISLETEVKQIMDLLLKKTLFDKWQAISVELSTYTTFNISCMLNKNYYSTDELEELPKNYVLWEKLKDNVFYILKGNRLPTSMKITLAAPKSLLLDAPESSINYYLINFYYKQRNMACTTGTSSNSFSLDRTFDTYWDNKVLSFFKDNKILINKTDY